MDITNSDAAGPQPLERIEEAGRDRLQAWRRPMVTHLAAGITGAVVALTVVGASIGFGPRERVVTRQQIVRVPVAAPPPAVPEVKPPASTDEVLGPPSPNAAKPEAPGAAGPPPAGALAPRDVPLGPPAKRVPLPPLVISPPRQGPGQLPVFQPPVSRQVVVVPKGTPQAKPKPQPAAPSPPPTGSALVQGVALAERGRVDEAIARLKEATAANPRDPQAYAALYRAYRQKMIAAEKLEDEERYRALANEAQEKAHQLLAPTKPAPPPSAPSTGEETEASKKPAEGAPPGS